MRTDPPSAEFVRLAQLRKLRECKQVAAVCYRVSSGGIEFLLVQTRGSGCWTFPKGSAEAGLTHAQAAALEAFEEAGVHGRIEEAAFARYVRQKQMSGEKDRAVNAHLCEVLRLSPPQESKRNRTWFSVEDAKRCLREGRKSGDGAEFARVIDRAVARIHQSRGGNGIVDDRPMYDRPQRVQARLDSLRKDALQKVQFDFAEAYGQAQRASVMPHIRRRLGGIRQLAPIVDAHSRKALPGEILEFDPPREKKARALGTGTNLRG
jgi:8-oxo-dGTP pyrophosphatase MutT (NUDIX family)